MHRGAIPRILSTLAQAGKWVVCALVACLGLSTLSCASLNEKTQSWQEEVVLSSGERVIVDRTTHYRHSSEPGNPFRFSWAREGSTLTVVRGPSDLVGANYLLKDWIDPVVLDKDPATGKLVLIGSAWNCDWVRRFGDKPRGIYIAFALRPDKGAEAIDFPAWAWNRQRNLYKPHVQFDPPRRVVPAEAERHNKQDARGHKIFFLIDPNYRSQECGGGPK